MTPIEMFYTTCRAFFVLELARCKDPEELAGYLECITTCEAGIADEQRRDNPLHNHAARVH